MFIIFCNHLRFYFLFNINQLFYFYLRWSCIQSMFPTAVSAYMRTILPSGPGSKIYPKYTNGFLHGKMVVYQITKHCFSSKLGSFVELFLISVFLSNNEKLSDIYEIRICFDILHKMFFYICNYL